MVEASNKNTLNDIAAMLAGQKTKPPVETWFPALSGDIDIVIKSDGSWIHEGGKIKREKLVVLFASILRREEDGEYYILTPVEKWRIRVEETAFLIVDFDIVDQGGDQQAIIFTTNIGDKLLLSDKFPLLVKTDAVTAEPSPIVLMERNLSAKLSRNVFYRLLDEAEWIDDECFIRSDKQLFSLGKAM